MLDITLTESQKNAFDKVKTFLYSDEPALAINGSAGVGKSTLMKYVVNYIKIETELEIAVIAPTHKALNVLTGMLSEISFHTISGYTVASILSKMKEHSYIGTKMYSDASTTKMSKYDVFILDEISMVCDEDMEIIFDYICDSNKKIILIGDNCQIPSPSQKLKIKEGQGRVCYKPDSVAFDIENIITLKEIVRQAKDSYIIKLATFLRDNIKIDNSIEYMIQECGINEAEIMIRNDIGKVYSMVADDISVKRLSTKIICYTNENVKSHNINIRKYLGRTKQFYIGDVIVGYSITDHILNGSEYIITDLKPTSTKKINKFMNLSGVIVTFENLHKKDIHNDVFFIDIKNTNNIPYLNALVTLAQQVNKPRSTKEDFRNYMKLKMYSHFIEDIYKFDNKILNEVDLRKSHPLLFTPVLDVINEKTRSKIVSDTSETLDELYPDMIDIRISDTTKRIGDTEVFADKYKIVEKDVFYGYAITSHKAQGSTYDNVYVDEIDFVKIKDKWNPKVRCLELRVKEKNQLRYVAYTRASKQLKIFI